MKWGPFRFLIKKRSILKIPEPDEPEAKHYDAVTEEFPIPELEEIRRMISDGRGKGCEEDLLDILRNYPRDIRVLDLYSRVLNKGHRIIIE